MHPNYTAQKPTMYTIWYIMYNIDFHNDFSKDSSSNICIVDKYLRKYTQASNRDFLFADYSIIE